MNHHKSSFVAAALISVAVSGPTGADFVGLVVEPFLGEGWFEHGYEGLVTYRLYAEFDGVGTESIIATNGWPAHPIIINSSDGLFWNNSFLDSLTAPPDFTEYGILEFWSIRWDTYITINATDAAEDNTALSPGFAAECGDLEGSFTSDNLAWYITPADAPQGDPIDGRILLGQFTVNDSEWIQGQLNIMFYDGSQVSDIPFIGPAISYITYVDSTAVGASDGTSWTDAFSDLQDAIDASEPNDQIWVAAGTYTPDGGTGDREAAFTLRNKISLLGGFAGGETSRSERDPTANKTILSGDLTGDDVGFTNNSENSYTIVDGSGTDSTALLDGFIITGGNADGSGALPNNRGAGVYLDAGSPTILRCEIVDNYSAGSAAGMCLINGSDPVLSNCELRGNRSVGGGGAMLMQDSSPMLINCLIAGNEHTGGGGAAGGIYVSAGCGPTLIGCTFSENVSAEPYGGAMFIHPSNSPALPTTLINCILWGDVGGPDPEIGFDPGHSSAGLAVVEYSCIQGGFTGTGNIDVDPRFVAPGVGSFRLAADSPCIDAGDNTAVPLDDNDLDHDFDAAERIPFDLDGNSRFLNDGDTPDTGNPDGVNPIVDMGAFEFDLLILDTDFDGTPDVFDNCTFTYNPDQADTDGSGIGDVCNNSLDTDDDEFEDALDNCPTTFNPDQDLSACQPDCTIFSITEGGGINLEVDAEISDPNGDPLDGSITISETVLQLVVLDSSNSFTDELDPGATISVNDGGGPIVGSNVVFACGTCDEATFDDAGSHIGGGYEFCGYYYEVPRRIVVNDDKICARSEISGRRYDVDMMSFMSHGWDCVENPSGSCSTAGGYTSYFRSALADLLSEPYVDELPLAVDISGAGLIVGEMYTLTITVSDGASPEGSCSAEFLYNGESALVFEVMTVDGIGEQMEEMATEVLTDAIDEILTDPFIPDEAANAVQEALDDVIGNGDGAANNGAADKFQDDALVAGITKTKQAVLKLQDAAESGFDTTSLQALLTGFAGQAVEAGIMEAMAIFGEYDPNIQAAQALVEIGDAFAQAGDFLDALDAYKSAAQTLP